MRILIVEDQPDTLREMTGLLSKTVEHLRVESALSQGEAIELLDRAASGNQPYDIAILDFKLPPHPGEQPEVNQRIYDEIRKRMKDAIVVHTSAYPDDPIQMKRILEEAKQSPLNPRSVFLSKLDHSWAADLVQIVKDVESSRKSTQGKAWVNAKAQFLSCFISYSHADETFVRVLYSRLKNEGLQLWYAAEHMQPGRKIHEEIEKNVRVFDKLLLVLSEDSMKSQWVATEIRTAIQQEWISGTRKLIPIRLVSFDRIREWQNFNSDVGKDMAVELREYFIPDFSAWRNTLEFEIAARKLIDSLRI